MVRRKDLTTYCTNKECPARAFCRRFTRRSDDEMPEGTVAMKFTVVNGGLHCGSYEHKTGRPSLAETLKDEMEREQLSGRKLLLWLRKCRASLSVARRALDVYGPKAGDALARSGLRSAYVDTDLTLNSTGGPHTLPEPFDILKYLKANGRQI